MGLARQLGTTWKTLWRAVRPRLVELADDESRLAGVATLGVDEHAWHHTPHKAALKGPTMLTGMVDLTRNADGKVHAGLLDLVPSRSGTVFAAWLTRRTAAFRDGVQVATLDYFTTERSSTGGTEAINGVIELRRRIARGYRNRENYRLRMLLVAGGLDSRPLPDVR